MCGNYLSVCVEAMQPCGAAGRSVSKRTAALDLPLAALVATFPPASLVGLESSDVNDTRRAQRQLATA